MTNRGNNKAAHRDKPGTYKPKDKDLMNEIAGLPATKAAGPHYANQAFKPTLEMRKRVQALVGYGLSQEEIASVVINPNTGNGIATRTLKKHFDDELKSGKAIANSQVAQSLYNKAMGSESGSVTACIFWLKCQAGWRETVEVEHRGNAGVLVVPTEATPQDWMAKQLEANGGREDPMEAALDGNGNGRN